MFLIIGPRALKSENSQQKVMAYESFANVEFDL